MKYDRGTRWLHAGIALGVSLQLLSSQLMQPPEPGEALKGPAHTLFLIHRTIGINVATLVILHWCWALGGHVTGGWGHLFPWFSGTRFRALISDVRALPEWLRGRIPDQREQTVPLAGAVHGLGLLAVSGMALTGGTIFFGMAPDGSMPHAVEIARTAHSFIANFIWTYYIGHASMAVFHQWRGERLITDMFNLSAG